VASKRHLVSPDAPQNIYPPNGPQYPTRAPVANSTYDYIVVGSGPGGAPVAARLALAGFSVLLLDAGEDHGRERQVEVPALHVLSSEYDPIRWDYFVDHFADETEARKDTKMTYLTPEGDWYTGLTPPADSQRLGVLYPRVGALGGCSQHNALVTILPNNNDWENIAQITGDKTWGAKNMRKYFQKLEKCQYLPNSISGHGFNGWLQTQVTPLTLVAQDLKVLSLVVAAATAMGKGLLGKLITTVTGLAEVCRLLCMVSKFIDY
jgi:choline dehydrogenase